MACTVPNLIAALGRKSRPAVKEAAGMPEKLNKSYHLPHFIHFFEGRRTGWLISMYLSNPIPRTRKRKKEDALLRRSRVKTSSY